MTERKESMTRAHILVENAHILKKTGREGEIPLYGQNDSNLWLPARFPQNKV